MRDPLPSDQRKAFDDLRAARQRQVQTATIGMWLIGAGLFVVVVVVVGALIVSAIGR